MRHARNESSNATDPVQPALRPHYRDGNSPIAVDSPMKHHSAMMPHARKEPIRRIFPIIAVVAALVVAGGVAAYFGLSAAQKAQGNSPEAVASATSNQVDYHLPSINELKNASSSSLKAFADEQAGSTIDRTSEAASASGGVELIHLAEGVDLATAAGWYAQGVDSLSAADAARLLNGTWQANLSSSRSYDCRLRFALFDTPDQQSAVSTALEAIGLSGAKQTDQGTDSYGNTYVEGTVKADKKTRIWRVAACPLSSVYSNSGLPANASYVVVSVEDK